MNEMMMSVGDVMRKAVRWERGVRMWWMVLRRKSGILNDEDTGHNFLVAHENSQKYEKRREE